MAMSLRRSMVAALIALWAALAIAIALALLNHTARAADEGVTITSLSQQVGETGTVTLSAVNIDVPPLGAWEIDIFYEPSVVTPVECTPEGANSFCNPQYRDGQIRLVGADAAGTRGDSIALASITFTCGTEGSSPLALSISTFADTNGFQMPASTQDAGIECLAPSDESQTATAGPARTDTKRTTNGVGTPDGAPGTIVLTAAVAGILGVLAVGALSWRYVSTTRGKREE
jgi:hypothetical protein